METTSNATLGSMEELNNKCMKLEKQNAELAAKVKWFEEQFRLSQHKRFGASSEKTPLQVLHEPGRTASQKSYMWLYRTGRGIPPIILYDYQTTRAGKHPCRFLAGYKGYLQTDGYSGYNDVPDIIQIGCFSHARRYFDEAIKALPESHSAAPVAAKEGLNFCNQLFAIERD